MSELTAEYFVLAAMQVLGHAGDKDGGRRHGVRAGDIDAIFPGLPDEVLAPSRQRRAYMNGVLARAETSSTYLPARKLWVRKRLGEYVPNPSISVRVADERGGERWCPMEEHLGLAVSRQHSEALAARWRAQLA